MGVFSNWSLASEREHIEAKSQLFNVQNERRNIGTDTSRLTPRKGFTRSDSGKTSGMPTWSDANTKDNSRTACQWKCTLKLRQRDQRIPEEIYNWRPSVPSWKAILARETFFPEINRNTKRKSLNNPVKKVNYIGQGEPKKCVDSYKALDKTQNRHLSKATTKADRLGSRTKN